MILFGMDHCKEDSCIETTQTINKLLLEYVEYFDRLAGKNKYGEWNNVFTMMYSYDKQTAQIKVRSSKVWNEAAVVIPIRKAVFEALDISGQKQLIYDNLVKAMQELWQFKHYKLHIEALKTDMARAYSSWVASWQTT